MPDLSTARAQAERILAHLMPSCEDGIIAGSVRREKPEVHDVELVLLPKRDADMFGDPLETYSELDRLKASSGLVFDPDVKRNGPRLKRLLTPDGLIVELYIADERNFGNLVTIRTGSADYTRWLVTDVRKNGGMPANLQHREGYLKTWPKGEIIPCRTERDFFQAIEVEWIEPRERTAELAARMYRR